MECVAALLTRALASLPSRAARPRRDLSTNLDEQVDWIARVRRDRARAIARPFLSPRPRVAQNAGAARANGFTYASLPPQRCVGAERVTLSSRS